MRGRSSTMCMSQYERETYLMTIDMEAMDITDLSQLNSAFEDNEICDQSKRQMLLLSSNGQSQQLLEEQKLQLSQQHSQGKQRLLESPSVKQQVEAEKVNPNDSSLLTCSSGWRKESQSDSQTSMSIEDI